MKHNATPPILPGNTIGILGGGQLGRMLALASSAMGYTTHVYSPESKEESPAGQVATYKTTADYTDKTSLQRFAEQVSVVTVEFENIPIETLDYLAQFTCVRPSPQVLYIAQNRLREKTFLKDHQLPVVPFYAVRNRLDLIQAIESLGYPCLLKTAGFGYDGKGQFKIASPQMVEQAIHLVEHHGEMILEQWIDYEKEISVVAARDVSGHFRAYPVAENRHQNHILDVTLAPARVPEATREEAVEMTRQVMDSLDVVGVLCVEFFVTPEHQVFINEIAPRPHNSGHWTIEGAITSQFEQQLRAVCGLPLGDSKMKTPVAGMKNLLGDLWQKEEPNWLRMCDTPALKLHLYGKLEARPGRKMGHLTLLANTQEELQAKLEETENLLNPLLMKF